MDATTSQPRGKRARDLDQTEQARDAKQRRVEPDAQAPSRVAAQLLAGVPTRNATTGATASTQLDITATAASRAARIAPNGTPALCAPPNGPGGVADFDMLAPPSSAASGRAVAGRSGPKRVILIVRPPANAPISSLEEPMAAKRARKSASNSKRPLAAITNVGEPDAQTAALPFVADDRSAWGNAFVLQAPPASARRPAARTADDDPCYCSICLRAMVLRAMAAEAMAAAASMTAQAAALPPPPPPPPPPPMLQFGQASGSSTRLPVDDGDVTTTEIESETD